MSTRLNEPSKAIALYTHESNDSLVLNFEQGDYLDVNKKLPTGWWQGSCNGTAGWFPRNYVAVVDRASTPEYEQTKDLTDLIEDQLFGECLTSAQPTSPLPKHWTLQTTKDGKRHYYYNRFTGEMRPTLPDAEDANINLFDDYENSIFESSSSSESSRTPSLSQPRLSFGSATAAVENDLVPDKILQPVLTNLDNDAEKPFRNETTEPDDQSEPVRRASSTAASRKSLCERLSITIPDDMLNIQKLSSQAALAIGHLNTVVRHSKTSQYVSTIEDIVDAVRLLLFTSGTVDKTSIHVKHNCALRAHYRALTASLGRLILTAQLCTKNSAGELRKLLINANELLIAVQNFAQACQMAPISIADACPKLVQTDEDSTKETQFCDEHRPPSSLQEDVVEAIEACSLNVRETVQGICDRLQVDIQDTEPRQSLGTLLFSRFRYALNQVGQLLVLLDSMDCARFAGSASYHEVTARRQSLSDGIGQLFCYLQKMTEEDLPMEYIITEMSTAAKLVNESVRTISECISRQQPTVAGEPAVTSTRSSTTNTTLDSEQGTNAMPHVSKLADRVLTKTFGPSEAEDRKHNSTASLSSYSDESSVIENSTHDKGSGTSLSTASPDTYNREKLKRFFGGDVPETVTVEESPPCEEVPWFLKADYDPKELLFDVAGFVRGGTLKALTIRLTTHDKLDMNFISTFLLTYRSFCTSMELLSLLKERYQIQPPAELTDEELEIWRQKKLKLVRLRVFNVMKTWLEQYYNEDDVVILEPMLEFTHTVIRDTMSFSANQLERLIQKRQEAASQQRSLRKMVLTLPDPPEPILPRNLKNFRLLDIDPLELARQMTIMDFKLYNAVHPVECLDKAWSRDANSDKGKVAVNIRAAIDYCNHLTKWVAGSILGEHEIKKRLAQVKYWIQVAEKCRQLNNFNTCMAIISAFDNSSVGRLKRTWEMVGARTNTVLAQIRKLMGTDRNFNEYRAIIHSINPPCIPFLGIYLQDLTFIEDGNPNFLKSSNTMINFAKRAKTAEIIREIEQYQSTPYQFKPVEELQAFIMTSLQNTRDEDMLYQESLEIEPREREDEKITRLLQESGFL